MAWMHLWGLGGFPLTSGFGICGVVYGRYLEGVGDCFWLRCLGFFVYPCFIDDLISGRGWMRELLGILKIDAWWIVF